MKIKIFNTISRIFTDYKKTVKWHVVLIWCSALNIALFFDWDLKTFVILNGTLLVITISIYIRSLLKNNK